MATINTADDLIEVLRADSRVRSAVRRELLTDALVALPEKVDKMVESQTAMQQSQTAMQQAQTAMQQSQTAMQQALTAMLKTQTKMLEDIENLQEGQTAATEHRDKLHALHREEQKALRETHEADRTESIQDMHRFRGNYAVSAAANDTVGIAMPFAREKNMRQIRCDEVSPGELKDLVSNCKDEQVISEFSDDDLNYFPQVDLAFGVMGRRDLKPSFYIAVEAGYTGDSDDVDRAITRAKILGALTGKGAYAVVAAVHLNSVAQAKVTDDAKKYLASNGDSIAYWYQIVETDMEPPSPR